MDAATTEKIYLELLELDRRLQELVEEMQGLTFEMRETRKVLAEGQARNDALKQKLFGNRFQSAEMFAHG
ncbi:hypothetical protein [Phyllobacterium pellucidum]|uniref:hypothetical protein n=1 Tax=Phyllobacterium pellucidum TaxID=2740464 RepID=UPI001D15142E|nr:hypothetical protein [Phyllobacterium sp. T1018]UGY08954.1 hypothetical protein LLE51_013100 [Phyllobacterium sp. T1018]